VRRADNPHVDGNFLAAADPLDHALLQEAEELYLKRDREIAHFIKKERPAARGLDLAERALRGSGVGTFFVAEQLGLEQGLRYGRAVDRDEPSLAARR
jgi:hypothetical protein